MKPPEIPGLQFTALLAKGEMFTTWKATKESLQREVDVRVLNEGVPPEQAEHQLAMARTLARLTHPGLAQIHDVITEGDATHVIMEHVEGASLAEMVAGTGRLNSAQALRLALQLAEALDYAWTQAQVVFRSLKPQNLRVNRQGTLKISEYSLAIQVKPGENPLEADQGHVIGTPHFIAPEQAALSPAIDFRADMYSLGTVLYFMLTGTSPFEGRDNYEILEQQVGGLARQVLGAIAVGKNRYSEIAQAIGAMMPPPGMAGMYQAQMNMQGPMQPGMPMGPQGPMAGGAPAGPAWPSAPSGSGANSASMEQLEMEAQEMASQLYTADPITRRRELVNLKHTNPTLHSRVKAMLEDQKQQVASEAVAQSQQPQQ